MVDVSNLFWKLKVLNLLNGLELSCLKEFSGDYCSLKKESREKPGFTLELKHLKISLIIILSHMTVVWNTKDYNFKEISEIIKYYDEFSEELFDEFSFILAYGKDPKYNDNFNWEAIHIDLTSHLEVQNG